MQPRSGDKGTNAQEIDLISMNLEEVIKSLKISTPTITEPEPLRAPATVKRRRSTRRDTDALRIAKTRAYDVRRYSTVKGLWRQQKKWLKQRAARYRAKGNELKAKGCELVITLEEWTKLWESAGQVWFHGKWVQAHEARGPRKDRDVQLIRIDDNGPWELSNLKIIYNKGTIADGRRVTAVQERSDDIE